MLREQGPQDHRALGTGCPVVDRRRVSPQEGGAAVSESEVLAQSWREDVGKGRVSPVQEDLWGNGSGFSGCSDRAGRSDKVKAP